MLLLCVFALPSAVFAEDDAPANKDPFGINQVPRATQGTGVEPKIGTMIDPDIHFHDHDNRFVKIGDYFGDKPLMLSFNYSNCPKLCSVQLENMVKCLARIKFQVGVDFDMVSVSIDPLEQSSRSREQKDKYVHMYNQGESINGFHFLTGEEEAIDYLADLCDSNTSTFRRKSFTHTHRCLFWWLRTEKSCATFRDSLTNRTRSRKL